MKLVVKRLSDFFSRTKTITYDEAKKLAGHKNPKVRRGVAVSPVSLGEIDLLLARDADQSVRTGLAGKIAKLAPELSPADRDQVRRATYEALEVLAQDQVIRVRQILAEALKDVANAPPRIINKLARDAELVVSAPVLEFSPVLTDEDLLEIIAAGPCKGAICTIARRKQVVEIVADAIVDTHDVEGITDLLANSTAQIREATLDRIVEKAPDMEVWHEPLIQRSPLPPRVARRLAMFVADNLLNNLTSRKDLDPETAEEVRKVVARRLAEGSDHETSGGDGGQTAPTPLVRFGKPMETPHEIVLRLYKADKLDEKTIAKAIIAKDQDFVVAALSQLSQLPRTVVNKAFLTENTKGLISVAWKAGLSPCLAVELQKNFFHLPPQKVLGPKVDGDFPLGQHEMAWQLDFLKNL